MKTGQFRGVPLAMQQDGWWLDAPDRTPHHTRPKRTTDSIKAGLLVALIAVADILVWGVIPGLSLAVLGCIIVMAGLAVGWPAMHRRARLGTASGTVLCLLPLVELVQPLSILIALAGLSVMCAALAGLARRDLVRGARRWWWVAPVQTMADGAHSARKIGQLNMAQTDLRGLALGWLLPICATVLFATLLIGANPILDQALGQLADIELPALNLGRAWFWVFVGVVIWPVLVAKRMQERLRARRIQRATVRRQGLVNAASVARSLVAFNALFAVQTGMDILFLYGNVGLPDGISPATYAHRGAYPLLCTALLAGVFAVLARPFLAGRPVVRCLMLAWLVQTLALVFASLWRLDAYVDVYGLTRLRVAAYVWMGLVAAGLLLVVWQIRQDKPAAWMISRSAALGALALYICAFVNIDGLVARHNLNGDVRPDHFALCQLSEGALPALTAAWGNDAVQRCRDKH
ncbi:MAG: DUF4173 domain-containing protein, partial [Pseudomonadota bacterium]